MADPIKNVRVQLGSAERDYLNRIARALEAHNKLLQRNARPLPLETEITHDSDTMPKVWEALREIGLNEGQIQDAVNEMQNAGILFREAK